MNGSSRRWFALDAGASNWLWVSAIVIVLDQLTKLWIISSLRLYEAIEVNAFFKIVRMHNEGAAFSILADASGWQRWFFISLGIAVSIAILIWLRRMPARGQSLVASGLALILGGALGNVIDRVVHGHVVDFIYLHYEDRYFPAFNVADSAITVGAVLLIIDSLRESRREARMVQNDD